MSRYRNPRAKALLIALVPLLPLTAHAADPETALSALPTTSASLILRALGSLGGVIALIALLAFLLRRLRESARTANGSTPLCSTGRLGLGGRREVRLVRVGQRTLVVGVTDHRIDLLTELPEQAADPTDAAREPAPEASAGAPVLSVLRKLASSP